MIHWSRYIVERIAGGATPAASVASLEGKCSRNGELTALVLLITKRNNSSGVLTYTATHTKTDLGRNAVG